MTQNVRTLTWIACAACAMSASASCKRQAPSASDSALDVRIALIGMSEDDPTWPVSQATASRLAEQHHYLTIEVMAPSGRSAADQRDMLTAVTDAGFDAAVVMPIDPHALLEPINTLTIRGLPVVTLGRDVPGSRRGAYCGPSEFELGRTAATACGRLLGNQTPMVLLLHAGTEDERYAQRYYGFQHEAPFANLTVLRALDGKGDPKRSARLVRETSRRFPRVALWAFLDDWPFREPMTETTSPETADAATSTGRVFESSRIAGEIPIVLCNGSPRNWGRLENGEVAALVTYDLREAVEDALFAAMQLGRGTGGGAGQSILDAEIVTRGELEALKARWERWRRGERTQPQR